MIGIRPSQLHRVRVLCVIVKSTKFRLNAMRGPERFGRAVWLGSVATAPDQETDKRGEEQNDGNADAEADAETNF